MFELFFKRDGVRLSLQNPTTDVDAGSLVTREMGFAGVYEQFD